MAGLRTVTATHSICPPSVGACAALHRCVRQTAEPRTRRSQSGTSAGTIVMHVAPEAAIGGPLALVRDGDIIALDAEARTLSLLMGCA